MTWTKEYQVAYAKKYREDNAERLRAYRLSYRRKNAAKVARQKSKSYRANPDTWRNYQARNRARINAYSVERRKSDFMFCLAGRLRDRLRKAFYRKGWRRNGNSEALLGCTLNEARSHIESKFKPGMTWANRDRWHIDHIIPLASAKTDLEMAALCRISNLQPLWAQENLSKHAKVPVAAMLSSDVDSTSMTGATR